MFCDKFSSVALVFHECKFASLSTWCCVGGMSDAASMEVSFGVVALVIRSSEAGALRESGFGAHEGAVWI